MRSAFVVDKTHPGGRRWQCPGCGDNCFGSSLEVYYCHGHSRGTATEQTPGCGYSEAWEDPRAPKFVGAGSTAAAFIRANRRRRR